MKSQNLVSAKGYDVKCYRVLHVALHTECTRTAIKPRHKGRLDQGGVGVISTSTYMYIRQHVYGYYTFEREILYNPSEMNPPKSSL